jgi:hypothetical protein
LLFHPLVYTDVFHLFQIPHSFGSKDFRGETVQFLAILETIDVLALYTGLNSFILAAHPDLAGLFPTTELAPFAFTLLV